MGIAGAQHKMLGGAATEKLVKAARLVEHMLVVSVLLAASLAAASAADPVVERGKFLAMIGGCGDCHTPGYFLGKPDLARQFGGSDVGFEVQDLGVFYGPNLTMDKETGLGGWSDDQIAAALTTGVRPDGRQLAPIMPWRNYAAFTKADISAVIAYLKSLPPVKNKVPGPFGPRDTPSSFVMKVVPPQPVSTRIEIGATLAENWCKGCHDIGRSPAAQAPSGPPTFKSIALRSSTTPELLDKFLSAAHTRMPNFALSGYDRDLLISYILSLK